MSPADRDILRAYRHLYTWSLRAVQYSQPARFTVRDRLRRLFRTNDRASFDQRRIDNTVEFLRGATREKGLEHRIVKRLLHVWWQEHSWKRSDRYLNTWKPSRSKDEIRIARTIYDPFYHKIRMLNEAMGMCIQ
ncbi:hypothetical protein DIS24_g432 [Lasiodiplodia hormozganensis]|uniref:DUF1763-domain-containing protein n=2 Tax=Lasiodiplodia TaxID=66739 RepID=A0A5N5DNJ2_9PEZI|nr:uncharacterized protein LTHEOB_7993 [Lasiodiplodia theobromae]KAB2579506.1 hypothetical protein DBV05_g2058 [Lasiodiplodia theobromae]KAF4542311.1 hypothetical protein LTHEOB_7993 [Lasiodiplodia theobromae]KAK0664796.1 hypothetical protein DIS24_g432 [Lasiodiplodia hormozganensis]